MSDRIQDFEIPLTITSECTGKRALDVELIKTGVLAALQSQVRRHLATQFLNTVIGLHGKKGAIINAIAATQICESEEDWENAIRNQFISLKRQWSSNQVPISQEKDREVQGVLQLCAEKISEILSKKGYVFSESTETPRQDVTAITPGGVFVSLQKPIKLGYCDTDILFSLEEIASGIADKLYNQFKNEFDAVAKRFAEKPI